MDYERRRELYTITDSLTDHPFYGPYVRVLMSGDVPVTFPRTDMAEIEDRILGFGLKDLANAHGVYPAIAQDWVDDLVYHLHSMIPEYKGPLRILEPMAGTGYITKAFRNINVEVFSSDDFSWLDKGHWLLEEPVTHVDPFDALDAVNLFGDEADFLLLSWPPYDEPIAARTAAAWKHTSGGKPIIYIGEDRGGCTADDRFFEGYHVTHHAPVQIPHWTIGINDYLSIGYWAE